MLVPRHTIVALVDGASLRLFRNIGDEAALRLVAMEEPKIKGHNKDAGKRHHVSSANPGRRLLEEDSFAAAAADWLNQRAIEGGIDRLIIFAAPKTLGELRRHYHKAVKGSLLAEIAKDLTGSSLPDIEAELKQA